MNIKKNILRTSLATCLLTSLLLGTPLNATHAANANYTIATTPATAPRTKDYCYKPEQKFGRMFPDLPKATWRFEDLNVLAAKFMAPQEAETTPEGTPDEEENDAMDAGYTYVGQFIDHDLTLDDRPNDLTTPVDPTTLRNGRTPKFDLDSVYGQGPEKSPELYEADGLHLKVGASLSGSGDAGAVDLPRDSKTGRALSGDARNDENRIVGQLHMIVVRFHNKLADDAKQRSSYIPNRFLFYKIQQQVRWHYQWAVLTDFLPVMVGDDMTKSVVNFNGAYWTTQLKFYNNCVTTPVEFSVAAYRFGHSMVRPVYRINSMLAERLPVFSGTNDPAKDLGGFTPSPANFAVDWKFFFQMESERKIGVPQTAYKMDGSLVFPLGLLPLPATGTGPASLAQRNLLRGMQLGLPSGQDVARAMGVAPLTDDQILVGKATGEPDDAMSIAAVSPSFAGKAPLWPYILAEATAQSFPVADGRITGAQTQAFRLGPVGGRIVAETLAGLMKADPLSVVNNPWFRPSTDFASNGRFGFKEMIQVVTVK